MSNLSAPALSLVAAAVRDHFPRWTTGQIFGEEGVYSTYRWEGKNRIVAARYANINTARAFTRQLNTEELLTQAFSVLCDATKPTSPELATCRTFLSNLIMALPLCPDENVFMTSLYPHPESHLVREPAESSS